MAETTTKWRPIADFQRDQAAPVVGMQAFLLIGSEPRHPGEWSDIHQCRWDEFGERWLRWLHRFPPTHIMPAPPLPDLSTAVEG